MEDDQQFCLRWNNHQSTLIQNFDTLLESGTLVDCTLAAEGKTLKAHKVVLSACSPYFECLLSEHYDKHPVFILKDVKFKELKAMMDYMYRGEVNISQDQLAALLKAAESLQIKGLSESKTTGSSKTESRPQKPVSQPTAPSLDIPHSSSGLTIEKNKVPRQSMTSSSVGDIPEDTASPQAKGLSSKREGSQSPTPRKRKRIRRRSSGEENTIENQDASSSSDMPQQMSVPALGIAPVADEKVHSNPTDSLGRSTLMTQLTKPADEMLQLPLEKPEPNDNFIEPKSEFVEETEEGVEDLTLDDDMNDLNDMEQDNNRAGPSHDSTQHSAGLGTWHVTGNRSNAEGIYEAVGGGSGPQDEVYLAQEAAQQAHRDSQGINSGFDYFKSFTHYSSPIFPVPVSTDFIISNESARSNAQAKVVCSKCDKTFACEYSRNRHINDNICGKIGNLEYKFACKFCKKRYKLKGSLTRHQNQDHKKNKPKFKCPFDCDKSFGYPFILNRHIENIHKKKMKSNADPQTKKTKQGKKTKKTTETYPNQQLPFESVSRCSSRSTSLSDKQRATVHKTDYTDGNGIVSTTSTLYSKYIPIPIYDRLNPPKEKSETADYNKWLSLTGDTTIISYKQYPKLTDGEIVKT